MNSITETAHESFIRGYQSNLLDMVDIDSFNNESLG